MSLSLSLYRRTEWLLRSTPFEPPRTAVLQALYSGLLRPSFPLPLFLSLLECQIFGYLRPISRQCRRDTPQVIPVTFPNAARGNHPPPTIHRISCLRAMQFAAWAHLVQCQNYIPNLAPEHKSRIYFRHLLQIIHTPRDLHEYLCNLQSLSSPFRFLGTLDNFFPIFSFCTFTKISFYECFFKNFQDFALAN